MSKMSNGVDGRRLVVGISGASGAIFGVRLLELLKETDIETHLIMSRAARLTLTSETDFTVADVEALATVVHSNQNIGAGCSSDGRFHKTSIDVCRGVSLYFQFVRNFACTDHSAKAHDQTVTFCAGDKQKHLLPMVCGRCRMPELRGSFVRGDQCHDRGHSA